MTAGEAQFDWRAYLDRYHAAQREEQLAARADRVCVGCGTSLPVLMRSDAKWCSSRCSSAAYHAAQREKNPPKYGWVHCPRCGRMLGIGGIAEHNCIPSFEELFWARVDASGDCWLWMGPLAPNGYGGRVQNREEIDSPHRWAYRLLVGPIPEDLTLDHLCRVHHCVNPDHLEPVTQYENNMRGYGVGALNSLKTHCPQGHPYDEANTYHYGRRRTCRICLAANEARYRAQKED